MPEPTSNSPAYDDVSYSIRTQCYLISLLLFPTTFFSAVCKRNSIRPLVCVWSNTSNQCLVCAGSATLPDAVVSIVFRLKEGILSIEPAPFEYTSAYERVHHFSNTVRRCFKQNLKWRLERKNEKVLTNAIHVHKTSQSFENDVFSSDTAWNRFDLWYCCLCEQ